MQRDGGWLGAGTEVPEIVDWSGGNYEKWLQRR